MLPGSAGERRVLFWMCLLIGVNQLGFGAIVPVLPLYAQAFGVTASAVGLAVAIYGLARFLVAMPSGRLSDALGRRPTLALGGLLSAAGNFWCAWAADFPEFILARFLAGAGAGVIVTTGQVVLADITRPEWRGRAIGLYQGVFIFSVGIGPFPGGWLAESWGLAAPFAACGAASLMAGAIAWFAVGETRGFADPPRQAGAAPSFAAQLRLIAAKRAFLLISWVGFINAFTRTGGLFTIVPIMGHARLGLDAAEIGFGLALGSVLGLAAAWPTGLLVDRFGRKTVIVPATMISGGAMLAFALAPSYAWFAAGCALWSVATSVGGAAPAAYAADNAPAGMNAAAISSFRMLGDAGYVLGPVLLGMVVDAGGAGAALHLSCALLVLTALAFARFAPETRRL